MIFLLRADRSLNKCSSCKHVFPNSPNHPRRGLAFNADPVFEAMFWEDLEKNKEKDEDKAKEETKPDDELDVDALVDGIRKDQKTIHPAAWKKANHAFKLARLAMKKKKTMKKKKRKGTASLPDDQVDSETLRKRVYSRAYKKTFEEKTASGVNKTLAVEMAQSAGRDALREAGFEVGDPKQRKKKA